MSDFLFEIGTEELPVAAVQELSEALLVRFQAALQAAHITHGLIRSFGTPRRLAVLAQKVAPVQAGQTKTRRGPAVAGSRDANDQPSVALLGFAKSCGVTVDDLDIQTTDKGAWWVYIEQTQEIATTSLLPGIIQAVLAELPIRKAMRWGTGELSFSRPVHWAVMLWGREVLTADILGVTTGRLSYGHRFHHPEAVTITEPNTYEAQMLAAHVIPDFQQRRMRILEQITQLAEKRELDVVIPEDLLTEVTSIVEWPRALLVDFDPQFLTVPAEALIAAMQVHQKCFAVYTKRGQIAPHFITVSNIESRDESQVITGNAKVMRARLSDAAFFYEQDKRQGLAAHRAGLQQVVFQTQLGSLADKARRIEQIMGALQEPLHLDPQELWRAAALCKCDLLTGMVGEFPELQGVMGYYYAMHDDEPAPVALALKEQYFPRFSQDDLPTSPLGYALSLADRFDTLYGLFAIGHKPTGVKDPFKLRRHALAIARMFLDLSCRLSVRSCLQAAADAYVGHLDNHTPELMTELQAFILDRLQAYYHNLQVPAELFHAVRVCQSDDLYDMAQRITALQALVQLPQAHALIAMAKRVNNIVTQSAVDSARCAVDLSLCHLEAEHALLAAVEAIEQQFNLERNLTYPQKLNLILNLQPILDAFFDQVMVMDPNPDLQYNRLALLLRLRALFRTIADLSQLAAIVK